MAKLNKDIIFLYSEGARRSIKEISKTLRKSPQRVKYTLKLAEKQQYIYNPYCIFDYSYFGLILFRVYFRSGYISDKDKAEIIRKLSENQYFVSMYELRGEFDLVVEMESPNPSRFNKELKKIANMIPALNNYRVLLNLVTHIYPRRYMLTNHNLDSHAEQELILGGDRPLESFSKNEFAVMKNLLENPRLRMTTLAKKSGINVKTAKVVLENLADRRIIKGFKYLVDTEKMGIEKSRLLLKLHNLNQEREDTFLNFMLQTREIVQVNKTVGDWDMEVDIEALDRTAIRKLIVRIREDFKDLIENFNIIEFNKYYRKSYLPSYLFNG